MSNENQYLFSSKCMIEDKKRNVIPQYFDMEINDFQPVIHGDKIENNDLRSVFSKKSLLVDKKGRPIPQHYNTETQKFEPLTNQNGIEKGVSSNLGKFAWVYNEQTESLDLVFNK